MDHKNLFILFKSDQLFYVIMGTQQRIQWWLFVVSEEVVNIIKNTANEEEFFFIYVFKHPISAREN